MMMRPSMIKLNRRGNRRNRRNRRNSNLKSMLKIISKNLTTRESAIYPEYLLI